LAERPISWLFREKRFAQSAKHPAFFFRRIVNPTEAIFAEKALPPPDKRLGYDLKTDPVAISKKRAKSVFEILEQPSAMFDESETAARRIWRVKPNRSSAGKFRVEL
jgi:hypothetical protein